MEAKCLIAHDRQSSGELRRTRLQNHNQALSHPKHQRGVGIILSGDVSLNKVFTLVKHMCCSHVRELFFSSVEHPTIKSSCFLLGDLHPIITSFPFLAFHDLSVKPRGRQTLKQEVDKREKVGAPVQVRSTLSCPTNFKLPL